MKGKPTPPKKKNPTIKPRAYIVRGSRGQGKQIVNRKYLRKEDVFAHPSQKPIIDREIISDAIDEAKAHKTGKANESVSSQAERSIALKAQKSLINLKEGTFVQAIGMHTGKSSNSGTLLNFIGTTTKNGLIEIRYEFIGNSMPPTYKRIERGKLIDITNLSQMHVNQLHQISLSARAKARKVTTK